MLMALLTLPHLLQACAPNIGPRTMTAIVRVESGGDRYAIHDNDLNRAFHPKTTEEAVRLAKYLLAKRHSLDLGISQINNANLSKLGMSVRASFNPCENLRGGATILAGAYRNAVAKFGPGQYALRRAIGAYNTGSLYAGDKYISMILDAAGIQDKAAIVARVPNLSTQSNESNESKPATQAPIVAAVATTPATAMIRPEDSPILVHWNNRITTSVTASGDQALTHISLNQTGMIHIPVTVPAQVQGIPPQNTPDQSQSENASAGAPIILRTLPMGTAQDTPQQSLQAAETLRRTR